MLPMGTIVTVCMFAGLLFASRLPLLNAVERLPIWVRHSVGILVFAAGAWNVFWHAIRHLTEFWGIAALVSGALMMVVGLYIVKPDRLPRGLRSVMPVIKILLLLVACFYAWTIYQL